MRLVNRLLLPLLLVCSCDNPEPLKTGELDRGQFEYICAGSEDAFCNGFVATEFPERFALTGRFEIRFDPEDSDGALPRVDTAAPDLLALDAETFEVKQVGTVALLALRGEQMIDFLHIRTSEVVSFNVTSERAATGLVELRLESGQADTLTATPWDEGGRVLAGALEYSWASADDSIIELRTSTAARSVGVQAGAVGTTELTVTAGGKTSSFVVIVGSPDDTTTSTTQSDTDETETDPSDTDTDSDSGDTDASETDASSTGGPR